MPKNFLSDNGKQALVDLIQDIESRSSAELVFAVRPASGSYLHADLFAAAVAAFMTLAFLLFSPWTFAWVWILIDPFVVGLIAALLASRSPGLRRLLSSGKWRMQQVQRAARSVFVEKRIHQTRDRTGLLIYISLLERHAFVVADLGVEAAVPEEPWAEAVAKIDAAVRQGADAIEVAAAAQELGAILDLTLERAEDDINELSDDVGLQ